MKMLGVEDISHPLPADIYYNSQNPFEK